MPPREVGQKAAERVLRRQPLAGRRLEPRRHRDTRRRVAPGGRPSEGHGIEKRLQLVGRDVESGETVPFLAVDDAHPLLEGGHLVRCHEPGVVVLVARERQAVALDGVRDEGGGPVVLHGAEGVAHRRQVVTAEVGHQPPERVVVVLVEQGAYAAGVAEVAQQLLAPRRAALVGQGRVARVLRRVDPLPQRVAARPLEGGGQQAAVLENLHPPVEVAEDGLEPIREALHHHRVETLAVVVDDPPDVADIVLPRFHQRLEDVALVELGVARDGDHAARGLLLSELLEPHVVLDERREAGHRPRRGRPIRWRSRRRRRPSCGKGTTARPRTRGSGRAGPASGCPTGTGSRGTPGSRAASPPPGPRAATRRSRAPSSGLPPRRTTPGGRRPSTRRARAPDVVRVVDHPDGQPQDLAFERAQAAEVGRGALGKGGIRRSSRDRHQG